MYWSYRCSPQVQTLKKRVRDSGRVKIFEDYDDVEEGVALVYDKLLHMVNIVSCKCFLASCIQVECSVWCNCVGVGNFWCR